MKINDALKIFGDMFFNFFKKWGWLIVLILVATFVTVGKIYPFPYKTGDYNSCLSVWMGKYKELGFWKGIGTSLGDYTPTYNYYLCLTAQFTDPEYFYIPIKALSIASDLGLASAFFFIGYKVSKNLNTSTAMACISMVIPSVIINGAIWGQCDVIFTTLIVYSFYFYLDKKYNLVMIMFSIAFALKLQAIFFLPFLFLFFLKRKIKLWQFLYIPAVYLILALPAIFAGRSFIEIMTIYFKQAGEYPKISMNGPSIYAFLNNNDTNNNMFHYIGIFTYLAITTIYIYIFYRKDFEETPENLISIALFSVLISPYVLPHMHDRYFFIADIFSILYVLIKKRGYLMAVLINFASMACNIYFCFGENIFSNGSFNPNLVRIGSCMNLGAIILLVVYLSKDFKKAELN